MEFLKENRIVNLSKFSFKCENCEKIMVLSTIPPQSKLENINHAVVWGNLSTGIGFSQCQELLALLNVPFMAPKTSHKITGNVKKQWEEHLYMEMKKAGEDEKKLAVEKGHVTKEGIPYITVIADGSWSKRTYGHGYNASSGVGVIIGAATKKPLFLGVRNKYCSYNSFYKKSDVPIKAHECVLNFHGTSTEMEQDIIVQGFCNSVKQHGIMYKYIIAEGDASVYARIIQRVSYGIEVQKMECANHMTRCLSDKLHKLSTNTTILKQSRKFLTEKVDNISKLKKLVKGIRTSIKRNVGDVVTLRAEITNAPYHVFGKHNNCSNSFCNKDKKESDEPCFEEVEKSFFLEIRKCVEQMVNKADRLINNVTTNQAERYMALVAKFVGGKRINFSKRYFYTARAFLTGIFMLGKVRLVPFSEKC